MNEERMRELYARHTALRAASDPPCQVSLDAMIDVLQHRGSEETRREVMAEILRNPACREEFELLRAVVRASVPVPAPSRFGFPLSPAAWRWAAGIAAVVGLGLIVTLMRTRPADQLRGGGSSITLYGPKDEERVSALPNFVWGSVEGAIDYRFQLLGQAGQVVYTSSGTDTVALVPQDTPVPAGRYLWTVTAELVGGNSINSRTRGLVLSP